MKIESNDEKHAILERFTYMLQLQLKNNLITHHNSLLAIAITSQKVNQTNRDKISPCLVLHDERILELQHSISKVNAEERAFTATSLVQSMT